MSVLAPKVKGVAVRSGRFVDQIIFKFDDNSQIFWGHTGSTTVFGNTRGSLSYWALVEEDYIVQVNVRQGAYVYIRRCYPVCDSQRQCFTILWRTRWKLQGTSCRKQLRSTWSSSLQNWAWRSSVWFIFPYCWRYYPTNVFVRWQFIPAGPLILPIQWLHVWWTQTSGDEDGLVSVRSGKGLKKSRLGSKSESCNFKGA